MSATRRWFVLLTIASVVVCVASAHTDFVQLDDLPTGDAGYYTMQAMELRDLVLDGDLSGFLGRVFLAEVHPFVHPCALATWITCLGDSQEVVRSYGVFAYALCFILLAWLCGIVDPRRGWIVGLVVVFGTATSTFFRGHFFTAMTEPTSLIVWLLAIGLLIRFHADRRPGQQLAIGLLLLLAALVRYNLFPMLVIPLFIHHLIEHRSRIRSAFDSRLLLWIAPTVLFFAIWLYLEPDLVTGLKIFFFNRRVDIPFFDVHSLTWLPRTVSTRFLSSPALAIVLFGSISAGLLALATAMDHRRTFSLGDLRVVLHIQTSPGLRLLQLVTLVAVIAITAHPYKISRNLIIVVPLLYACALLPFTRCSLVVPRAGRRLVRFVAIFSVLVLLSFHGYRQIFSADRDLVLDMADYLPDPEFREVLDVVSPYAMESRWLFVYGIGYSPALVPLWIGDLKTDVQVFQGWDEQDVVDASAGTDLAHRGPAGTATFVVIVPPLRARPPSGFLKHGEVDDTEGILAALEAAAQQFVLEQVTDDGWTVHVYQQRLNHVDADLTAWPYEPLDYTDARK